MIKTSEQGKKLVQLSRKSPNTGKRGPSKKTLLREEVMREHIERNLGRIHEADDMQYEIMKLPIKKKNPNPKIVESKLKAAEKIIDRAIGKAKISTDITSGGLPIPILQGLFEEE